MRGLFLLFLVFVSFLHGCRSGYKSDEPLVQVGEKSISGRDLDRFIGNLPEHLRFESLGDSTTRAYLQS